MNGGINGGMKAVKMFQTTWLRGFWVIQGSDCHRDPRISMAWEWELPTMLVKFR